MYAIIENIKIFYQKVDLIYMVNCMRRYLFLFCFLMVHTITPFTDQAVYFGTIQMPTNCVLASGIRVWHEGKALRTDFDPLSEKVSFEVSIDSDTRFFYLVISHQLSFQTQDNTVTHFEIVAGGSCKMYCLELTKNGAGQLVWEIQQLKKMITPIPVEAVVVYCPAEYVQEVVSTSSIEFPKIVLKNNLIELLGSAEKLDDILAWVRLHAIDYDPVHETVKREIKKQDSSKTIIVMNVP